MEFVLCATYPCDLSHSHAYVSVGNRLLYNFSQLEVVMVDLNALNVFRINTTRVSK